MLKIKLTNDVIYIGDVIKDIDFFKNEPIYKVIKPIWKRSLIVVEPIIINTKKNFKYKLQGVASLNKDMIVGISEFNKDDILMYCNEAEYDEK